MPLWSCPSLVKQIRLGVLYYFLSLICSSLDLSRTWPTLPSPPSFSSHFSYFCHPLPSFLPLSLFMPPISFLYLLLLLPINSLLALSLHFLLILFLLHTFHSTLVHFFTSLSLCVPSLHSSSVWPTPKPTRRASSAPTFPATSSRIGWSTSCPTRPRASACSQSEA